MYLSRKRVSFSGQSLFEIPFPYLSQDHVHFYVDGTEISVEWIGDYQIRTPSGITGAELLIKRSTPNDGLLVTFTDGSILKGSNLREENLQLLFVSQEAIDDALDSIRLTLAGYYDANGNPIKNVAAPIDVNDVVTLGYADSKYGGEVVNRAEQARDAAIAQANLSAQLLSQTQQKRDETISLRNEFSTALTSTFDRFAGFYVEDGSLKVYLTDKGSTETLVSSNYRDVVIVSGSAQFSISPNGELLVSL